MYYYSHYNTISCIFYNFLCNKSRKSKSDFQKYYYFTKPAFKKHADGTSACSFAIKSTARSYMKPEVQNACAKKPYVPLRKE